jgi:hypothetical protein
MFQAQSSRVVGVPSGSSRRQIIIPPDDVLDVPATSNAASGSFENVGAREEQGTCIHYLNSTLQNLSEVILFCKIMIMTWLFSRCIILMEYL